MTDPRQVNESDLVRPDLTIDRIALHALARRRAAADAAGDADMYATYFTQHMHALEYVAAVAIECRRERARIEALPAPEQHIISLELELEKARNGLAMPLDEAHIARVTAARDAAS